MGKLVLKDETPVDLCEVSSFPTWAWAVKLLTRFLGLGVRNRCHCFIHSMEGGTRPFGPWAPAPKKKTSEAVPRVLFKGYSGVCRAASRWLAYMLQILLALPSGHSWVGMSFNFLSGKAPCRHKVVLKRPGEYASWRGCSLHLAEIT